VVHLALALAFVATIAAGLPAPGLYVALGAGIAAVGCGRIAYRRRHAAGGARLAGAAAIAVGAIGALLGAARIVLALAAIHHLERLL
jgi:hypothetical protein